MSVGNLEVEPLLEQMSVELTHLISQRQLHNPYMIGIRTGGAWIAERLHQSLQLQHELGVLDISFYRDDFSQTGLNPNVKASALTTTTEGKHIILVDDVLMTGRSIRAAMNELFDFGRPESVTLVALVELPGRELPIQADVKGVSLPLSPQQQIKLSGPHPLELMIKAR